MKGHDILSIYSITISGEGIENIPLFQKPDKKGWSKLKSDIYDCKFDAYKVHTVEGAIGMDVVPACGDIDKVIYNLAKHYPEKEFHYHIYCHDGYWRDFDFGFKDGEYCEWNYESHSVYDDFLDDEEYDCEEFE